MYSLGEAAPVNDLGYFDVPIHNEYSNPIREGNYIETPNYQFNNNIANTVNNSENYLIQQSNGLGNPSPSLYYEQDKSMSGYQYPENVDEYQPVIKQKKQFYHKQIPQGFQQYELENFQNQQAPKPPVQIQNQVANRPQMPNNISNVQPQQRPSMNRNPPNKPMVKPPMVNSQHNMKPTNRPIKQHRGRHKPYHHQKPEKIVYNNYIPYTRPDSTYYYDYIPRFVPNNYLNIGSIPNIAGFYSNWYNNPFVEDVVYNEPVIEDRIEEKEIIIEKEDDKSVKINEHNDDSNEEKAKSKRKKTKN